jgi:hypothetical protein
MIFINYLIIIFLTINEIVNSNLWIISICEIIVLGIIVSLASRTIDKILRGLKGIAVTTIIVRVIHDAYKFWKDNGSNSNSNDSEYIYGDKVKFGIGKKPKRVPTVTNKNEK